MAGGLVTISARRPLRAAIGLLVHIISLAGMFLTLNAQLLAALQLLVYAGAVVVLFVFVIMLIGPASEVGPIQGRFASRTLSLAVTIAIVLAVSTSLAYFDLPWGTRIGGFRNGRGPWHGDLLAGARPLRGRFRSRSWWPSSARLPIARSRTE